MGYSYLFAQVILKCLYVATLCDHGPLGYFTSVLKHTEVQKDPKKAVNVIVDFLLTVATGHILAVAFKVLGENSTGLTYSAATRSLW